MKPNTLHRTLALAALLGAAGATWAAEPAKPAAPTAATSAKAAAPVGPVHPALGVALAPSVFVNDPATGRDPFYPGSNRRVPVVKTQDKTPVAPTVDRSSLLTLRGVSGPPERRLALINNQTFIAGEEGTVRTTAGTLKLRVIEVTEKSVRVVMEGDVAARELKLKETVSNNIQIQTSKVETP